MIFHSMPITKQLFTIHCSYIFFSGADKTGPHLFIQVGTCGWSLKHDFIFSGAVLVDFYAPWCPPCLKLLPELRKASLHFSPSVVGFISVDCTVHSQLCRKHSVTSYPTTLLYNSTRRPVKLGGRTASTIVEFVEDTITPRGTATGFV